MTEMSTQQEQSERFAEAIGASEANSSNDFAVVATALHQESDKLIALATTCKATAHQLAEQEAQLSDRERQLAEACADLQRREDKLARSKRDLDELRSRADEAQARITEAAEREATLKMVAESVLARYHAAPPPQRG